MHITEIARGIIKLLPYNFNVDLGKTDHPELEEKQRRLIDRTECFSLCCKMFFFLVLCNLFWYMYVTVLVMFCISVVPSMYFLL